VTRQEIAKIKLETAKLRLRAALIERKMVEVLGLSLCAHGTEIQGKHPTHPPLVAHKPTTTQELLALSLRRELEEMALSGDTHQALINKVKASGHNGYELSIEESLIEADFGSLVLMVAPYHVIKVFKK